MLEEAAPEVAVFVRVFLDAEFGDVYELLVLAYLTLLLGCSTGFAVKIGALSPAPCRPMADDGTWEQWYL